MADVTFTKDAVTFDVQSYVYPKNIDYDHGQVDVLSEGGTLVIDELLENPYELWILTFKHLTQTELDNLESFFKTTLDGMKNTFTFTDSDAASTQYTMRWMDRRLNQVLETYNSYTLVITLRNET